MPQSNPDNPHSTDDEPTQTASVLRKPMKPSSETKPEKKKGKKNKPEPTTFGGKLWFNWIKPIGSVIIVVVVIRSMLIDWNDVPTGSMEPEIHVGDRVAVNRLAYGIQFPLTGPKIGIPFIGPQFDNPLDGIPQITYGKPDRGDIVTFWNPMPPEHTRMIKRIVAIPGDTIEIRNSVMIINGTAATYTDLDAAAEGLEPMTTYDERDPKTNQIETVNKPLTYRRELLLDEPRITQHIEERWKDFYFVLEEDQSVTLYEGTMAVEEYAVPSEINPQLILRRTREVPVKDYLNKNPQLKTLAKVADGRIEVLGKEASHNELAAFLFKQSINDLAKDALAKIGLSVNGHELLVDDEVVFNEAFRNALIKRSGMLTDEEQNRLADFRKAYSLLLETLPTNFGPYTVPDDMYFMVGDNRNNSSDSRYFGPVHAQEITGQAFAVAFSFRDNKMFALPPEPAWERCFKDLD